MNTFTEMLRESKVVIDTGILFDYKFFKFLNANIELIKRCNVKLFLHKSVIHTLATKNMGNLIVLDNNNLIQLYGTDDFNNLSKDTLCMIISECNKEKFTLISKNFRLCKNADRVNDFKSVTPLGIESITIDDAGKIREYKVLDYNYIEGGSRYDNQLNRAAECLPDFC